MNRKIEDKLDFRVFMYLKLINNYNKDLTLMKKYILLLYLFRTRNLENNFRKKVKNKAEDLQINEFMKEINGYNNIDKFKRFIEINNLIKEKQKYILNSEECIGSIKFKSNDIWQSIVKINDIELGEKLYEWF